MANKTAGRVLFIGSINGRLAEQVSTAYDTSKGALDMMVKTLAVALAPLNIRVNGLAPGLVRTPATSWLDQQPEKAAWIAHHTPNGQIPDAAVCGPGAVYLVSDAAEHVQGHTLLIDGGMSWAQALFIGPINSSTVSPTDSQSTRSGSASWLLLFHGSTTTSTTSFRSRSRRIFSGRRRSSAPSLLLRRRFGRAPATLTRRWSSA